MRLEPAGVADLAEVAALMNRAFRADGPNASWNTEAALIAGDRTSASLLAADLRDQPHASLLVARNEGAAIIASIWLEPQEERVWYLGSLTVDPSLQNAGVGRRLLKAAEAHITASGGRRVRMTVVNQRDTLIAWYLRRGYHLTGGTQPFPYDDARFGVPKRADLCFMVLEKALRP